MNTTNATWHMKYLFHIVVYDYTKREFNFNEVIDNKLGANSVELIQACHPSNKNRMTN